MKRVLKNMAFIFILFILSYADVYAYEIKNNSVFSKEHVVAVIRKNQIWAIDVNNEKNKVLVDKGGKFSYPLISSTGYIAYRKNNDLYVSRIDFKNKSATYKVTDDVLSYIWHSNGSLLYSKDSGGLYVKDVKNNKNKILNQVLSNEKNALKQSRSNVKTAKSEKDKVYEKIDSKYKKNGKKKVFMKKEDN